MTNEWKININCVLIKDQVMNKLLAKDEEALMLGSSLCGPGSWTFRGAFDSGSPLTQLKLPEN